LAEKAKTKKVNPVTGYFRETAGELKKVTWPSRREAIQLTGLVIVTMFVVGIILFSADAAAAGLLGWLLS
jgi:preprotein translocase subunit SecE